MAESDSDEEDMLAQAVAAMEQKEAATSGR